MPHPTDGPDANPWVLNLDGADIQALVQVRRWAARNLRRVDDNHLGDVLLVATELVTNAYDHGNGPLQVRMSEKPDPCEVLIEVDDGVPEHPVLQPAQELRTHGRGMLIVNKLAKVWGVDDDPPVGAKTVWARVTCDGVGRVPCELAEAATPSAEAPLIESILPPADTAPGEEPGDQADIGAR